MSIEAVHGVPRGIFIVSLVESRSSIGLQGFEIWQLESVNSEKWDDSIMGEMYRQQSRVQALKNNVILHEVGKKSTFFKLLQGVMMKFSSLQIQHSVHHTLHLCLPLRIGTEWLHNRLAAVTQLVFRHSVGIEGCGDLFAKMVLEIETPRTTDFKHILQSCTLSRMYCHRILPTAIPSATEFSSFTRLVSVNEFKQAWAVILWKVKPNRLKILFSLMWDLQANCQTARGSAR
ncbi:hypothetical protein B0H10DRAFT_1961757 [Mycena sp. CBHHK59/15]|nr:hypothetical protein B0H10DRAFT_1961757 [Mycena sp. CBHHK59/15]